MKNKSKLNIFRLLFAFAIIITNLFLLCGCLDSIIGGDEDDEEEKKSVYKEYYPFAIINEEIDHEEYEVGDRDDFVYFTIKNISDSAVCNIKCKVKVINSDISEEALFPGRDEELSGLEPGGETLAEATFYNYREGFIQNSEFDYTFEFGDCSEYENGECAIEALTPVMKDRTPENIPRISFNAINKGIYSVHKVSCRVDAFANDQIIASEKAFFDGESFLYEDIIEPGYGVFAQVTFPKLDNLVNVTFSYNFTCERYEVMAPRLTVLTEEKDIVDGIHVLRITIRNDGNVEAHFVKAVISVKQGPGKWMDPLLDVARDVEFGEGKTIAPGETAEATAVFLDLLAWEEDIWFYYSWMYEVGPGPDAP
ncbi:hypothetical protein GF312_06625 [Candidatus Poribacteria bacterium]|nr:hypothetical protein [Candidatus Poribacteria bacterium]